MSETPVFGNAEIEAMRIISDALLRQPQEARDRILRWTVDKYGSDAVSLAGHWWITTGPLPAGGEKVLGPFGSQELALKVRSYMEVAQQSDGRTYWVDDEEPADA